MGTAGQGPEAAERGIEEEWKEVGGWSKKSEESAREKAKFHEIMIILQIDKTRKRPEKTLQNCAKQLFSE